MIASNIFKKICKKFLLLIIIGSYCILSSGLVLAITNCGSATCGSGINNCNDPSHCSNSCYNCYQQHVDIAGCRQYAVGMVKCFIDSCKDSYADSDGNWANGCELKVVCGTDADCNSPGICQVSPGHCINGNTVNAQCNYDSMPPKNISDISGNGNNGYVYCASSVLGKIGNAFNFNGVNSYVDLGNQESLKPKKVTISAWIKTSSSGNERFIAGFGNLDYANPQGYWIGINRFGNVMFYIGTTLNYDYITVSNIVNDNQWHHITETYDGTTAKLYVDGIFAGDSNS
ncbi:MAG: LamG domain-containing protein, partial [Candidatus Nanoarchaeia archaeon]|nr:LamG domain-containing protein [Candidatus Nanoarchaeia archaeon]